MMLHTPVTIKGVELITSCGSDISSYLRLHSRIVQASHVKPSAFQCYGRCHLQVCFYSIHPVIQIVTLLYLQKSGRSRQIWVQPSSRRLVVDFMATTPPLPLVFRRPIPSAGFDSFVDSIVSAPFQAVITSATSFNLTGSKMAMHSIVNTSGSGLIAATLPPPLLHAERLLNARPCQGEQQYDALVGFKGCDDCPHACR